MNSFAWWPTLIVVGIATFTDLRSRRIPNWLVLPFMFLGIGVSTWMHGWHGLSQSGGGIGMGLIAFGPLFLMGGMGAGDVKLCAAVGAWVGPWQMTIALILTALAGGLLVVCWAVFGGFTKELLQRTGDLLVSWRKREAQTGESIPESKKRKIPYAPAIAIGTLLSFFAR
jgi:prepilin peptidase CpaA